MKKGFTLIEMLVTVSLFAIIITIAVGGFTNAEAHPAASVVAHLRAEQREPRARANVARHPHGISTSATTLGRIRQFGCLCDDGDYFRSGGN